MTDELLLPDDCSCKILTIHEIASDDEKQFWYVLKKRRFFFNFIEDDQKISAIKDPIIYLKISRIIILMANHAWLIDK